VNVVVEHAHTPRPGDLHPRLLAQFPERRVLAELARVARPRRQGPLAGGGSQVAPACDQQAGHICRVTMQTATAAP